MRQSSGSPALSYSSGLESLWVKFEVSSPEPYRRTLSFLYNVLEQDCYPLLSEEKLHRPDIVHALHPFTAREDSLILISRHQPCERASWMSSAGYNTGSLAALIESVDESSVTALFHFHRKVVDKALELRQCYNLSADVRLLCDMVYPIFRRGFNRSALAVSESTLGNEWKIMLQQSFYSFCDAILYYLTLALLNNPEDGPDYRRCIRSLASFIRCYEHCFILGCKKGDPSTWIVLVD